MPGSYRPRGLHKLQKTIDPRVITIVAKTDKRLVTFSTLACHTTCLGPYHYSKYSADWPGVASNVIREAYPKCNSAFALSASGDVSPLTTEDIKAGGGPNSSQGDGLKNKRGKEIGEHVAGVIKSTLEKHYDHPFRLTLRANRMDWDPQLILGRPYVGWSLLGGAEDGGGIKIGREGRRKVSSNKNQSPKWVVGGFVQNLKLFTVAPIHPISQIQLGTHVFATVPAEITTVAGYRCEAALLDDPGVLSASVISNTNDYMGYITTPEEYDLQHYEGGHTLFGINSLDEYIKAHKKLQESSD